MTDQRKKSFSGQSCHPRDSLLSDSSVIKVLLPFDDAGEFLFPPDGVVMGGWWGAWAIRDGKRVRETESGD